MRHTGDVWELSKPAIAQHTVSVKRYAQTRHFWTDLAIDTHRLNWEKWSSCWWCL